jgi:hypothetical protein
MLDHEAINKSAVVWWAYAPQEAYQLEREESLAVLRATHQFCGIVEENSEIVLAQYVHRPLSCNWLEETQTVLSFEEYAVAISGIEAMIDGEELVIGTKWAVSQDLPLHRYSVAIKIYDRMGEFISQTDFELPIGTNLRHITLLDLADLQNGDYELRVSVYNWQTLEHLTGIQAENGQGGRETFIGGFTINRE